MKLSRILAFAGLCFLLLSCGSHPTMAIPADVKTMWYRFSRRADDYCIECSTDGTSFSQMRICHMYAMGRDIIKMLGGGHLGGCLA